MKSMQFVPELRDLPTEDLVSRLLLLVYKPPLSEVRAAIEAQDEPLRVIVLVADFDTEVNMNGLFGFLENSTGLYLSETIEALEMIEAHQTASVLRDVEAVMTRHRIRPQQLREGVNALKPHAVTTFAQVHGVAAVAMAEEVESIGRRLYVYNPSSSELPLALLCQYIEPRRERLLAALRSASQVSHSK